MGDTFQYRRRVEFRETDAARIAHFSSYIAYMEEAEHALLRSRGLGVMYRDEQGEIGFPRVNVQCDYRRPAHFEEILDIVVSVARLGNKSITYRFDFSHQGNEIATGRMTVVCCRIVDGSSPRTEPIPAAFVQALQPLLRPIAEAGGGVDAADG
jgi:acyl-CoA thioester hydrolase